MRSTGAYVLCFFAAIWAAMALHVLAQPLWLAAAPAALSLVLAFAAWRANRGAAPRTPEVAKRVRSTVMTWSLIEGVAIVAAVNILANTGHQDLTTAAVAVIVGLHFYPLAIGLRAPLYWLTGTALVAVAVACAVVMPSGMMSNAAIGFGSAMVLWLSTLPLIGSGRDRTPQVA